MRAFTVSIEAHCFAIRGVQHRSGGPYVSYMRICSFSGGASANSFLPFLKKKRRKHWKNRLCSNKASHTHSINGKRILSYFSLNRKMKHELLQPVSGHLIPHQVSSQIIIMLVGSIKKHPLIIPCPHVPAVIVSLSCAIPFHGIIV